MSLPIDILTSRLHPPDLNVSVLRSSLEEQRDFRVEQLTELRRVLVEADVRPRPEARSAPSSAGLAGDQARCQVTRMLAQAASAALAEIEAALDRLDCGSYGYCEDCAAAIAAEQLEILPANRYCASCQRRHRVEVDLGTAPAARPPVWSTA